MRKIIHRAGVGVVTFAVFATTFASSAFAIRGDRVRCVIRKNGRRSVNICRAWLKRTNIRLQQNHSFLVNVVGVSATSGGNKANNNTGGSVDVDSGDANVAVTITNSVNTNIMGPIQTPAVPVF